VVLNIATSGVSNEYTITSGSVPSGATISKVELRGTKSAGSGTVYWYVQHNASGRVASKLFASPATFNDFNGLTADTWSAVETYKFAVHQKSGKTLSEIRHEYMEQE